MIVLDAASRPDREIPSALSENRLCRTPVRRPPVDKGKSSLSATPSWRLWIRVVNTENHFAGLLLAARNWEDVVDMNAAPPPLKRNPSAWTHRYPIAVLAMVGGAIAAYLSLHQWHLIQAIWDPVFWQGSERVLTSGLAQRIDGSVHLPDASLGALAYFSEVLFSCAGSTRRWQFRPWLVVLFGLNILALAGVSRQPSSRPIASALPPHGVTSTRLGNIRVTISLLLL